MDFVRRVANMKVGHKSCCRERDVAASKITGLNSWNSRE